MKTYWNINGTLNTIKEWQPNCWIQVTCPTEQDQQELEDNFSYSRLLLIGYQRYRWACTLWIWWWLDADNPPYPLREGNSLTNPIYNSTIRYHSQERCTITVCNFETNMMLDFVSYQQKRNEGFTDYVDLIFRLFLSSAVWYLKRLKQINTLIEKAKRNLDKGVDNESWLDWVVCRIRLPTSSHPFVATRTFWLSWSLSCRLTSWMPTWLKT